MLVEVLVAVLILTVAIFGLLTAFTDSQKLSLSSERQSAMSHVAQGEIERIEGLPYASIGLNVTGTAPHVLPTSSTNPNSPDYYVTTVGSTPAYEWNHVQSTAEAFVTSGTVSPQPQTWSEGSLTGLIYDFVTNCASGCPSSTDNKRITVAVTVTTGPSPPSPVYVSSVVANPDATAAQGSSSNPITGSGCTGSCGSSPIDTGTPNGFFLHDCAATATTCSTPNGSHATHGTVGLVGGLVCASGLGSLLNILPGFNQLAGCPTPDKMNSTTPTGSGSTYQYSNDISTTGYVGRLLEPLCAPGSICGTGSIADCGSLAAWTDNLINDQNEMWTTPPLSTSTTLTGEGALNLYTETQAGAAAVVTLCMEFYAVPPGAGNTNPNTLLDLFSFPPTPIGGAAYVPATNPSTGSNWPTSPSSVDFEFNFASGGATVPAGDRIGMRIWTVAESNTNVALLYDSAAYPSEVQLDSQSAIQFSGS